MPAKLFTKNHFYYNSLLMKIRDDDITPHNSSWRAASTKKTEVEWERERKRENMKEKEWKKSNRQREREIGIFCMMVFVSATSSFLALLVDRSYRKKKPKKANVKTKVFNFTLNKVEDHFLSRKLCQVAHLQWSLN